MSSNLIQCLVPSAITLRSSPLAAHRPMCCATSTLHSVIRINALITSTYRESHSQAHHQLHHHLQHPIAYPITPSNHHSSSKRTSNQIRKLHIQTTQHAKPPSKANNIKTNIQTEYPPKPNSRHPSPHHTNLQHASLLKLLLPSLPSLHPSPTTKTLLTQTNVRRAAENLCRPPWQPYPREPVCTRFR